ncbi:hypothetical protein ACWGCW_34060 [Streptomyces sp. NPDC054933]
MAFTGHAAAHDARPAEIQVIVEIQMVVQVVFTLLRVVVNAMP